MNKINLLIEQDKKWIRVAEATLLFIYTVIAGFAVWFLTNESGREAGTFWSENFAWFNIGFSLPLVYLLYRKSNLMKIERLAVLMCCFLGLYVAVIHTQHLTNNTPQEIKARHSE